MNRLFLLVLAALAPCMAIAAPAGERGGKDIVDSSCAQCHAKGVQGAPRIGDGKAWGARAQRGLSSLEAGTRTKPHPVITPLADVELQRAITYMVNQSGGRWVEPMDRRLPSAPRGGAQIVNAQCIRCHGTGEGGAPRIGERAPWIPRLRFGLDSLVASAIHGHGNMPARGGMADLSDAEMRAAVSYMVQTSLNEGR